ncbi:hypothetical protein PIB30_022957 [Stylosanthes scabra]|uniref:Uncharacterized protein n=1 Tax=Stylosanthes scabra TaxID=79078 RepID=A0ABU6SAR7_9FABA|nr:hypothetical protein [Stylosanthes scabra]
MCLPREALGRVRGLIPKKVVDVGDALPELCRNMRLTRDVESERDYLLEAAGPFDRVLFRAERGFL